MFMLTVSLAGQHCLLPLGVYIGDARPLAFNGLQFCNVLEVAIVQLRGTRRALPLPNSESVLRRTNPTIA